MEDGVEEVIWPVEDKGKEVTLPEAYYHVSAGNQNVFCLERDLDRRG